MVIPKPHFLERRRRARKKRPRTHRVLLEVVTPSAVDQLLPEVLLEPAMRERAEIVNNGVAAATRTRRAAAFVWLGSAPIVLAARLELRLDRVLQLCCGMRHL